MTTSYEISAADDSLRVSKGRCATRTSPAPRLIAAQWARLWSMLNEPALTFNAYHLGGPGQGSREELDEHSQRRPGPKEWRPDPCSFRRHGRRSLAPDARQPGPVGAGHRRQRTGRYPDPG